MTRIVTGTRQYGTAFKLKVIEEIESGVSIREARRRYKIGGKMTIDKWIRALGNPNLQRPVKGVVMPADTIEQLKKEKAELEAALSRVTIKNICLESLVEATEEYYGIDLKKTLANKLRKSSKQSALTGYKNFVGDHLSKLQPVTTGILPGKQQANQGNFK